MKESEGFLPDEGCQLAQTMQVATSMDELKGFYGAIDTTKPAIAMRDIENKVDELKKIKGAREVLDNIERKLKEEVCLYMQDKGTLISPDGVILATFNKAKDSLKFNERLFKAEHAELWSKYLETREGNRSFYLK